MPTGPPGLAISPAVMPMLHLARADDAGAVRAEDAGAGEVALHLVEEPGLVLGGHALGDARRRARCRASAASSTAALHARRGDEDARHGGAGGLLGVGDRGEDRDAVDVGAGLLRVGAGHHLGAVVPVAQAVEAALRAGEALVDDLGVLVDEDAMAALPTSRPARRRPAAASSIVGLEMSGSDSCSAEDRPALARRWCRRGGSRSASSMSTRPRAVTMPLATSSPLVMPPKMLMKIDRTFGSLLMTSRAPAITSALAPPPMSRKLAGWPPTWLTTSTVDMASPAPLAMMPTVPSRPTYCRPFSWAACLALVALLRGVVLRRTRGGGTRRCRRG